MAKQKPSRFWVVLRYILRQFTFEPNQSPLFFAGIWRFLWRCTDFIPLRAAYGMRWLIGRFWFKKLGRVPHIRSHNTIFDGRELEIGHHFASGKYNYFAGGSIKIGNNVAFANYILVETTNHEFDDVERLIREQKTIHLPVVIGDDVWVGNGVVILGGVTIGDGSVIGAGSVVTKDIPSYSIAVGNPARVLRRRGEGRAQKEAGRDEPAVE